MADAATVTEKTLRISPSNADVNQNAVCRFTVEPAATEVSWAVKPQIGQIDSNGIYSSPEKVTVPQTVIVTATAKSGQTAVATIDLTDAPTRIRILAWYAIVTGVLLAIGILATWNRLYRSPSPLVVVVNPPLVTLDANKDEKFSFTAKVLGDSKGGVTWSVDGGEIDSTGTFRQKTDSSSTIDKVVNVTAKSVTDPSKDGTAVIHIISGKHLDIAPLPSSVFSSQQVSFRTQNAKAKWTVSRSDIASVTPNGDFTAGMPKRTPALVQVNAWGDTPHEQAAVAVVITAPEGTSEFGNWPLMLFVMMCGALGSLVYYTTSFVGYVGNQTFRSSWLWFYISRPFVGAALAVIFFFVVGSGMINGTSASELMKIGMVSALVGLFSDKAVKKLSDVLDVLLATKDDRKDKMTDTKTQSTTGPVAAEPPVPKIVSVDPKSIPPNAAVSIEIKGANFKTGFKVKVNGQDATPLQPTDHGFKLELLPAQVQAPKVNITVTTDQGTASFDVPVK